MKKIYYPVLTGLLCSFMGITSQGQPSDLVLNGSETGTVVHEATNSIMFSQGYSYTTDGGTMLAQIVEEQPIYNKNIVYSDAVDPSSYEIDATLPVGKTEGALSVSGTASFQVPITVPKGANGLQPNLSLDYTSYLSAGSIGSGWNIGGLSVISRVTQDIYNDGQTMAVDGTYSDRFALDGKRLLVTSGSYGYSGSEYRTEREEFSKIVAYGTSGQGPLYFIVYTKSGLICEYGNSADSRVTLNGSSILYWKVNKITDRYGNYMNFNYISSDDEHPIGEIDYTGNASQSTEPSVKVYFRYQARSNVNQYVYGGKNFYSDILLIKIRITSNGQNYKRYDLDYCEDKRYPLLQKITEYSSQDQPLNPLVFTYSNQTEQFSASSGIYSASVNERIYQGDFNGDGRTDIMTAPLSGYGDMKVYLADQNGNMAFSWQTYTDFGNGETNYIIADFNGDGLSDIMQIVYDYGFDFYYFQSTGSSFDNFYHDYWSTDEDLDHYQIVDYNGDGKLEVMVYKEYSGALTVLPFYELYSFSGSFIQDGYMPSTGTLPPAGVGSTPFQILDFNGDGCSDILALNDTMYYLEEFKGTDNKLILTGSGSNMVNTNSLRYGDFNGDGRTDILKTDKAVNPVWSFLIYTQNGFREQGITGLPSFNLVSTNNQWNCCDVNGDGKMDMILWGKGTSDTPNKIYVATNLVNGYEYDMQEYTSPINFDLSNVTDEHPLYFYFGDYNGDGREGFFYSKPGSQRSFSFAHGTVSNLMGNIFDGLGYESSISYSPSSDAGVYTRGTTPAYPLSNYTDVLQLVSAVSYDNGIGDFVRYDYTYEGAKVHLQGKGFLGFSKITEENEALEATSTEYHTINGTYYYPQVTRIVKHDYGTVTTTDNTWSELDFGNKRFFPYISSSTVTDNLTGLSTTTSRDYFADGNLKSVTENFGGGHTRKTEFAYNDEHTDSWLIGRPTTITRTSVSGAGTRTFVTNRTYFSTNNSPDTDQYNTGDASAWTLARSYDAFGNLTGEQQSATGLSARNTVYGYDTRGVNLLSVTDPVGRETGYTYDAVTGLIKTQTDPYGNLTTWNYNSADQVGSIVPDGGITTTVTRSFDTSAGPANARYYIQQAGSDGTLTKNWYDRLDRQIRNETRGFSGTMIKKDWQYNGKTELFRFSEPTTGTPSSWNVINYDDYARVHSRDPYYGATTTYSYSGPTTTSVVNSRTYTTTIDAAGQVTGRTDPGGSLTYTWWPDGLLKSAQSPGSVVTSMTYDRNGNRLTLNDPSAGTITETWYGTGEAKTHLNARGQTTTYTYQSDGLLDYYTASPSDEGQTNYSYNSDGQVSSITSPGGVSRTYTYDTRGRISTVTESIGGESNTVTYSYDSYGRLYRKYFDGTTDYEQYNYNSYGYLYRVQFNGTTVWQATAMDNYGRITQASIGGTTNTWSYDSNNMLSQIYASGVRQDTYSFDVNTGNLNTRSNTLKSLTESFGYDAVGLDRLTSVTGPSGQTVTYGSNGNIQSKSDAGTYAYSNTPYAVSSISGALNIPATTQQISYYSFEKVKNITEGTKTADFVYNADQQRIRMVLKDNGTTTKTRWYFGRSCEREQVGSTVTRYIWIGGDAYSAVALARKVGSGSWEVLNIFRDHLGTITQLKSGSTIYEYSYDAWGRRRDKDTWGYTLSGEPDLIAGRGFTGHEELTDFNLTNMNGRLYDPVAGRFLNPDPYVQASGFTQNFNRYSYALNNPLRYIDPNGNSWWSHFWNWAGNRFNNLGNWLKDQNVQAGINISGNGTVPFVSVPVSGNTNVSVGYNTDTGRLGVGNNSSGLNSFYYPSYNYNRPEEIALQSIENARQTANGGGNSGQASNIVSGASLGVSIAENWGYDATIGIWKDLSKIRYYASGWTTGNQYVLKPLSITKGATSFLYGADLFLNYSGWANGQQSGLETGLNVGVSTTSLIVGGTAGIGVAAGYGYLKYMWNTVIDYGQTIRQYYQETYQNLMKGTPFDPQYQY